MTERSLGEESTKLHAALEHKAQLTRKLNVTKRLNAILTNFGPIGDLVMLITLKLVAEPEIEKSNKALGSILKDLKD